MLWSCEKITENELVNERFDIKARFKKEKISFSNFKSDKVVFSFLSDNVNLNKSNKSLKGKFNNFNYIKLIDSSKIILFKDNDLITYTFPVLTTLDKGSEDFFNLVIKKDKEVLSAFVIKYIPKDDILELQKNEFVGKVEIFNSNGKRIAKGKIDNLNKEINQKEKKYLGKSFQSDDCIPKFEPVYTVCGCGGNADGHAPSGCPNCNGSGLDGYNITICPNVGSLDDNNNEDWQDDFNILNDNIPDSTGVSTGGDGTGGNTPTSPTSLSNSVSIIEAFSYYGIILSNSEITYLIDNMSTTQTIINFLNNNRFNWAEKFTKEAIKALSEGKEVDFIGLYIENDTPDDNYVYQGPKQLIPSSLVLSNGSTVNVTFITYTTDNKSSNQQVAKELVDGLKFALEQANSYLSVTDKITTINVYATTNGTHTGPNHYNGTALDINSVNGERMAVSGITNQITELQKAFDNFQYIRENFGPYFKHKYTISNNTWNYSYPVDDHKNHIHISIRK